ncbi:MAG: hypothetical protein B7C24_07335 [Bacteroidetes bacterium 4572_77]|nr:MAG: hypothetical protein B7C24_07335 [Bacteroidetes bacterium 4572_77]
MRILILIVSFILFSPTVLQAQIFQEIYKDFLKYGTVYGAGDISNSIEAAEPTYFLRTNPDGSLYSIPDVVDNTPKYPFDYRYGFGIRKLARFDYERKPKNFYDGTEEQLVFSAPTSAVQGLEYQFHYEKERWRGENFTNYNYFLKHTGKYHIVKLQAREVGKINLKYNSAEVRGRLPIGKKFSFSAGAILRGHERAYGYNPVEIWLNEIDENGNPVNQWYELGRNYGYNDIFYEQTSTDPYGNEVVTQDWYWINEEGEQVASSDLDFRERIMPGLMNRFNGEAWDLLDPWLDLAPIVGVDFYHYKKDFWLHAYANYILPYHKYIAGEEDFSYMHRNSWGLGGHNNNLKGEQWHDYSFGVNLGTKIGKNLGIFIEGEYSKMWDSKLYQTTFGLNYTFK